MDSMDELRADLTAGVTGAEKRLKELIDAKVQESTKDLRKLTASCRQGFDSLNNINKNLSERMGNVEGAAKVFEKRLKMLDDHDTRLEKAEKRIKRILRIIRPEADTGEILTVPAGTREDAAFSSLIQLLDDKGPDEDDASFKRRNDAGIRTLFQAGRSLEGSSAKRLYTLFVQAFRA